MTPHLYPLLKNGVLLHPQEPGTPGRIERFPSEPSGHWASGRAMGLLSALSVGPRGLARDREEAEGLPRPRPLPILGQVWADFKDSNFKSVQKQILSSKLLSPQTFDAPAAQAVILKGPQLTPRPSRLQARPTPGYSQPHVHFWVSKVEPTSRPCCW